MALAAIPVERYLVPAGKPTVPEGFARIDVAIAGSLPHVIALEKQLTLVVAVPNGLAVTWRDADPTAQVSGSGAELGPFARGGTEIIGDVECAPARLFLRLVGRTIASIPFVVGMRQTLPRSGQADRGVRIELVLLSWDLRAGNLRGPGDYGSKLSLAWRPADRAVEHFSTAPINPKLIPRLAPEFRMQSVLGLRAAVPLARFRMKKAVKK
jgi:hypothetical protein